MGFLQSLGKSLVGGAGDLVSSLAGGALGSLSQSSANKTNLEIAHMNNEYNERMMQKQMDYNTQMYEKQKKDNIEMWNMENEYNSASAQRKRYEEAGLNPSLMMGNGNAGVASSMSAPSSQGINPPTAVNTQVQPNTHMATAIGQGFEKFLNTAMALQRHNAEIENIHIENKYKAAEALARISNSHADTYNKRAQAALTQTQNSLAGSIAHADINLKNQQAESEKVKRELIRAQTATEVQNKLLRIKEVASYGERFANEMAEQIARIALLRQENILTEREAQHELEKMWTTAAQRNGINLDNKKKYRTLEAEIERVIQETLPAVGRYGANMGDWTNSRKYGYYP